MASLKIKCIYVISVIDNVAAHVQSTLQGFGLDIQVREFPLSQYGTPIAPNVAMRKLSDPALLDDQIEQIEYLLADQPVISQVLEHPRNRVKWVQNTFAGVEMIFNNLSKLKMDPDLIITRTSNNISGQMMGEYVIGHIIARERNFLGLADCQQNCLYEQNKFWPYRVLTDLSIGILGLGNLGTDVVRMAKAMGMSTWAVLRDQRFSSGDQQCSHVDHVRPVSRMEEALREVDYLVSLLPSTPDTRGLLSGETLKACRNKKTVLINLGRGDIIDDESLIYALKQGWIGGAILDVHNKEPVPINSPLWGIQGVTITPHVSCSTTGISMLTDAYIENLQKYLQGNDLRNQVDLTKGY
ncbi:uncharacterized protein in proB 3'region [Aplysia californica]|uniref:Uncharacterized protein in proB 3'region n=1 Tax=Aplysia californica TaxID=6500 RepID=A0ABM0JCB7_APLCA|nr:uncharacterized protein in proB 3'region [Aplysia californica]